MMKKIKNYFRIIWLVLSILWMGSNQACAGGIVSGSDSLSVIKLKIYENAKLRAQGFYGDFAYIKGIPIYKKALRIRPEDDTLRLKIARGYYELHELDSADFWYRAVISKPVVTDDIHFLNFAEIKSSKGEYTEAEYWFERYAANHPNDKRVRMRIQGLKQIIGFYEDSVRFTISSVPFNSDTYDFSPSYYQDELLFVSARETSPATQFLKPKYKLDKTFFLNLFSVDSANEVKTFERKIQSSYHEGPVTFYDNDTKVIFTRNNFTKAELRFQKSKLYVKGAKAEESKEGVNKLKLFYSEKLTNDQWSTPVPLWFNSDEYSTGHPTVSKDGKRLYFASDRDGGLGGTDIYRSVWYNSVWGEPENLGILINTEGDEMFPFVDENEVLYYSSNGKEGLGGLDIFKVDLKAIDSQPENVGYPVNSSMDDFGLIAQDYGDYQSGYFSSNRAGGLGLDDIYAFRFEKRRSIPGKVIHLITGEPIDSASVALVSASGDTTGVIQTVADGIFQFDYGWDASYALSANKLDFTQDQMTFSPKLISTGDTLILKIMKEVLVIKGTVTDKIKGDTLDAVRIIVSNDSTGAKFGMKTGSDGSYSFIGEANTTYSFSMKKHRYFTEVSQLSTGNKRDGEIIHNGSLEEIIIGKPVELNDIHFDLAKWDIRPDAAVELDKFTEQLMDNPSIIVELSTHTDCRGSDSYNLSLSDHRAKSSAEYVIKHGISKERLMGTGYGEQHLLNECDDGVACTEEQHQRNRRAEFKVTGFLPNEESNEEKNLVWISPDFIAAGLAEHADRLVLVDKGESGEFQLSGYVKTKSGEPLSNVLVSVMEKGQNKASQVKTAANGQFELNVKSGKIYRVVVQLNGYLEEGIEVDTNSVSASSINFELEKDQQL